MAIYQLDRRKLTKEEESAIEGIVRKVEKIMQSGEVKNPFTAFDFDNTLVKNDIGEAVFHYMAERDLFRDHNLLGRFAENPETRSFLEKAASAPCYGGMVFSVFQQLLQADKEPVAAELLVQSLSKYKRSEVEGLVQLTLKSEGQELGKRNLYGFEVAKGIQLNPATIDLRERLTRDLGIYNWIISASPLVVVRHMVNTYLDSLTTGIVATQTRADYDRVFSRDIVEPFPAWEGKLGCIQHHIHPTEKPILGIGDSKNDKAMIEYSLVPVVVNRKPDFVKYAREKGMDVL